MEWPDTSAFRWPEILIFDELAFEGNVNNPSDGIKERKADRRQKKNLLLQAIESLINFVVSLTSTYYTTFELNLLHVELTVQECDATEAK